jgi:ubiquinone/menaquinone biosynthesis C-methylase UbiE
MNSTLRRIIQKYIEFPNLRKLSDLQAKKNVLEIGCGTGYGTRLIKAHFQPQSIHAIDVDQRMITIAKKQVFDPSIVFEIGDAASLRFKNNTFNAVFDIGVLHHISNWKKAIDELYRVLKKGGSLIVEDLSREHFETMTGRLYKRLTIHPYDTMYRAHELRDYLKKLGFRIIAFETYHPLHLFKYFVLIAKK